MIKRTLKLRHSVSRSVFPITHWASRLPLASVAIGVCIIEKQFTLSRGSGGSDSTFALAPGELRSLVETVREAERSLCKVSYELSESEKASRVYRRSLFMVQDINMPAICSESKMCVPSGSAMVCHSSSIRSNGSQCDSSNQQRDTIESALGRHQARMTCS